MGYVSRRRDGAAFVFLCEVSLPDFEGTVQREVKRGEGEEEEEGEEGDFSPLPTSLLCSYGNKRS